eukprot:COSAG01_NODE_7080_length_3362_cov_2.022372_5_plen_66_part_00
MFPSLSHHDQNRRRNQQKCRGISATATVLIMKYYPQGEDFLTLLTDNLQRLDETDDEQAEVRFAC